MESRHCDKRESKTYRVIPNRGGCCKSLQRCCNYPPQRICKSKFSIKILFTFKPNNQMATKKIPPTDGEGTETTETKTRKARTAKHAKGSPHELLHSAIDTLTGTEATVQHRHIKKHY